MRGNKCRCCSDKPYDICCKPLHLGAIAKNALELMRSRFCAYALNLPDYVVNTTHFANPEYSKDTLAWKHSISEFSKSTSFNNLEILDFKETETFATVTFTAYLSQDALDQTFTERSYFEKFNGLWLYKRGKLAKGSNPDLINSSLNILPLAYYGNPVLQEKATSILEITAKLKDLVAAMIETMDVYDGIGIAAPQINHSIRLFIIRTPIEIAKEEFTFGDVQVFINPILSEPSDATWVYSEGCLSLPHISSDIERPKEITVEYTSLDGILIKKRFCGLEARIIMHENDHIDGILLIDHLDPKQQLQLKPLLQAIKQRTEHAPTRL